LESAGNSQLKIDTRQVKAEFPLGDIGLEPKVWDLGFLEKSLQVYHLPDVLETHEVEFSIPIKNLKPGDNPIYICAIQEDGFLVWSSPIYLVR
jgi:hypothetical protein